MKENNKNIVLPLISLLISIICLLLAVLIIVKIYRMEDVKIEASKNQVNIEKIIGQNIERIEKIISSENGYIEIHFFNFGINTTNDNDE